MNLLEQVKDGIAKENGYSNWDNLKQLKTAPSYFQFWLSHSDEIAKRYAKTNLDKAAENFEKEYKNDFYWKPEMEKYKQSISNTPLD